MNNFVNRFYVDEGLSGTLPIDERPDFYKMFTAIQNGKISEVYCLDQSRIERNTTVWDLFSAACISNNCKYCPNGIELNIKDDTTKLQADILSLINSYYAKITSSKVKLANQAKVEKGKTHGLKPYGYGKDEDNQYLIIEEEAKHVRDMYKMSLEGKGAYQIAKVLNKRGVPTRFNAF